MGSQGWDKDLIRNRLVLVLVLSSSAFYFRVAYIQLRAPARSGQLYAGYFIGAFL